MQLYMQRRPGKGRKVSVGLFRSETEPTFLLRVRLELEAEEKVALYQDRKLLYSRALRWSNDSEKEDVMIMQLVEASFMDFDVVDMERILNMEEQLEDTASVIKQRIAPIIGMGLDLEVVRDA